MGIAYDCFWYWRKEFLGQPNPYQKESNLGPSETLNSIPSSLNLGEGEPDLQDTTTQLLETDENCFQNLVNNDAFFSEWNWSTDGYLPGELSERARGSRHLYWGQLVGFIGLYEFIGYI